MSKANVFNEFKARVRDTIRDLCAKSNSTEPFLDQRYFWCAYDLVRKRRANHIQSWRNHGRPSNFTYGGRDLYEATYGKIKDAPKQKIRQRSRKKQLFPAPAPAPASASAPASPPLRVSPPPPEIRRSPVNALNFSDSDDEATMDYDEQESQVQESSQEPSDFDPFADVDLMEFAHAQCKHCQRLFDWNNAFQPDKQPPELCDQCESKQFLCTCESCGEKLNAWTAFPKGNSNWAKSEDTKSWCGKCYAKVLREKIIPDYNARMARQEAVKQKQKRKRNDDCEPAVKKQKTPCNKCGAFTHKTARSRLCPHNVKYKKLTVVTPPATRRVTPPPRTFGGKAPRYPPPMAVITEPVVARANPPPQPVDVRGANPPPPRAVDAGANPPPPRPVDAGANNPPPQPVDVGANPPPPRPVTQLVYAVGSNVLARFNRRQFALAHIIKRAGTHYDVYFPDDGVVKRRLAQNSLRPCPDSYAAPKVSDMLDKTFVYEGDEEIAEGTVWRVRQIVDGDSGAPEYRCSLTKGTGKITVTNFDVGFVMRTIKKQFEKERETGPKK